MINRHYQCRLQQKQANGTIIHDQAFIPDKGAHLGKFVELKGEQGFWEVTSVDRGTWMDLADIAEKQRMDRNQRAGSDI